jgi:copper chaperone CopZ
MRLPKSILILAMLGLTSIVQAATVEMTVNGLVCSFCAQGIEKTLRRNAATADVLVSLEQRLVAVAMKPGADIPDDTLRKALADAGYDVKAIARTERSIPAIREQLKAVK